MSARDFSVYCKNGCDKKKTIIRATGDFFSRVMRTLDRVSGLHKCLEFS